MRTIVGTPVRLLLVGVLVFAIGFVFGSFEVDPLSAWIGTAGMVIAAVAIGWLTVVKVHSRRPGPK